MIYQQHCSEEQKKSSLHSMQFSWNSGIHVIPALTMTVPIKNESQFHLCYKLYEITQKATLQVHKDTGD